MTRKPYKLKVTREKTKDIADSLLNLSVNGVDVGLQRISQERLSLVWVYQGGTRGEDLYMLVPESRLASIPRYTIVLFRPEHLQQVYKRAVQAKQTRQMGAFLDIFYRQVNQVAESVSHKINDVIRQREQLHLQ